MAIHRNPEVDVNVGPELRAETIEGTVQLRRLIGAMRQESAIWIDLRQCRKFDVVALLHLLAATARRSDRHLATRFRLPSDMTARDYLRRKSFASAIGHVTQTPLRFLVDPDGARYFGEVRPPGELRHGSDVPGSMLAYLADTGFFALRPYSLTAPIDRRGIIFREWDRWRSPIIERLLERQLDQRIGDFTRVVVQELLANTLQQSATGVVVTASHIDSVDSPSALTVAAWWGAPARSDPMNVAQEFLNEVAAATVQSDTANGPSARRDHFQLTPTSRTSSRDQFSLRSPGVGDTALSRLQSSSQAALSREPTVGPADLASSSSMSRRQHLRSVGHGLRPLYRSLIDDFGGQLEIWSDDLFLRIEGAEPDWSYRVLVDDTGLGALHGNIIAARIPLTHD